MDLPGNAGFELVSHYSRRFAEIRAGTEGCAAVATQAAKRIRSQRAEVARTTRGFTSLQAELVSLPHVMTVLGHTASTIERLRSELGALEEGLVALASVRSDLVSLKHKTAEERAVLAHKRAKAAETAQAKRVMMGGYAEAGRRAAREAEAELRRAPRAHLGTSDRRDAADELFNAQMQHFKETGRTDAFLPVAGDPGSLSRAPTPELDAQAARDLDAFLDSSRPATPSASIAEEAPEEDCPGNAADVLVSDDEPEV